MIDYLMDDTNDLQISNGDFVKGECNQQNQRGLLIAEKGDYKQSPIATVGLTSFLNDDTTDDMLREIRLRFSDDGMDVKELGFIGTQISINADYAN